MSWPTSARHLIPAPLRISLLYALFGISWIVLSDLLVWREGDVSAHGLLVGLGKGLVFVLASALLLYTLVRREVARRERTAAELRGVEDALRQAHKLEAVGRLAGGVAHEFNNILTAIIGHAALLLEQMPAGDERRDHIIEVRRAADRAATLTRQLLVFSGKHVTRPDHVDLGQVLRELRSVAARVAGDAIRVELQLAESLWPVRCDVAQIQQLVLNLVVNATEAMSDGGTLALSTANVPHDAPRTGAHPLPPGEYVMLSVSDTGAGMSADTLGHLFEPFFTTKAQGTGLGLATVYGIVQQTDGHIRVDSEPGRGASFHIYLPRATSAVDEPENQDHADAAGAALLVVEDDDAVRDLTCRVLRRHGHSVLSARNGPDALALLTRDPDIRLVIADIVMPGMNGFELGARIRADHPTVRILYTSGYVAPAVDSSALGPGMDFMEKPYRPDELIARINAMLATG